MTERPIPKPIDYRQYAGEIAEMSFFDAPDEVDSQLDDLRNALAGTDRSVEQGGSELVGLKNSLICMHDVLKAYEEHEFKVPKRLTEIHRRLESRRNELDPQGPDL